ncbi:MAG: hypothetical protein EOP58_00745 [Sphingomonadales bacterium]|nr:MAG: hypothetical protein EOP58_00745 [Sphingomonadales bacterium]
MTDPSPTDVRLEIARIIDPEAWSGTNLLSLQIGGKFRDMTAIRRAEALNKAVAILALVAVGDTQ